MRAVNDAPFRIIQKRRWLRSRKKVARRSCSNFFDCLRDKREPVADVRSRRWKTSAVPEKSHGRRDVLKPAKGAWNPVLVKVNPSALELKDAVPCCRLLGTDPKLLARELSKYAMICRQRAILCVRDQRFD